jgi:hypothetical protein
MYPSESKKTEREIKSYIGSIWSGMGYCTARSWHSGNVAETLVLAAKYHADEITLSDGRQWSDGGELLIKFVIWK